MTMSQQQERRTTKMAWMLFLGSMTLALGAVLFVNLYTTATKPEPEVTSGDPCANAVAISAETFELYEQLVRASSQMSISTMEWDIPALTKDSETIAELSPRLEESFSDYEREAELCRVKDGDNAETR